MKFDISVAIIVIEIMVCCILLGYAFFGWQHSETTITIADKTIDYSYLVLAENDIMRYHAENISVYTKLNVGSTYKVKTARNYLYGLGLDINIDSIIMEL